MQSMFNAEGFLAYQRSDWHQVADVAFSVFGFLDHEDLRTCAQLSWTLSDVANDEMLWERLLVSHFGIVFTSPYNLVQREKARAGGAAATKKGLRRRGGKPADHNGRKKLGKNAKDTFKQEWQQPRSKIFQAVRRMKAVSSVSSYRAMQLDVALYGKEAEAMGLRSYFEEHARRSHKLGTRVSILHQLKSTAFCCLAMIGIAVLHRKDVGTSALVNSVLAEIVSTPAALIKSDWASFMILGSLFSGCCARLWRITQNKKVAGRYIHGNGGGTSAKTFSLSMKEKSRVMANYCVKEVNDGLIAYVILPLFLVLVVKGLDFYSIVANGWVFKWAGNAIGGFATVASFIAWFNRPAVNSPLPAVAFLFFASSFYFEVPILYNGLTNILRLGLFVFGVVLVFLMGNEGPFPKPDIPTMQKFNMWICGFGIFGGLRLVCTESLFDWGLGWFGYLATLGGVEVSANASSYMLLSRTPLNQALGLLALSTILNRWGTVRAATSLYAKRWKVNPLLAVAFDAMASRVYVHDGLGAAMLIRVLCSSLYVFCSG